MGYELADPSTEGLILPSAPNDFMAFLYAVLDRPWGIVYLWLAAVNLAAFLVFGLDKLKAVRSEKHPQVRRIQEHTLLLLAVLGGSAGALLAMKIFRHKTDTQRFTIGVPLILLAQILIPLLLYLHSIDFFHPAPVLMPAA